MSDDDLKELLAKRQHAKPNKVTWALLIVILIGIGFAMGACMQKGVSTVSNRSGAPDLPSAPASASDPAGAIGGGPSGGFASPPDITAGTIQSIGGSTLTIATRDGKSVTVEVPDGTPVTSQVEVPLGDLPVGASVVIRGSVGDDGTVTADSVSEGAGLPGGGMRNPPAP